MSDPKAPWLSLLEPEELARLAERARLDVQGAINGEPVKEGVKLSDREEEARFERDHARLVRGLSGLRVAARAYALARDPEGLRPIVWGTWGVANARPFDTHVDSERRIATAVLSAGARLLEVPGLAERLASSDSCDVRYALARALPEGPTSEPLLRALAQDGDTDVREAAAERIGPVDRWGGAFPIPPDDHPDEVLAPVHRVLALRRYAQSRVPEEVVSAFAPLSDALAVACWERVLSPDHLGGDVLREWLAPLLERPGGGAALGRLVVLWESRGRAAVTSRTLDLARERLSEDARARAFAELLGAVREQEIAEREGRKSGRYLRRYMVEHAVAIAPEEPDARVVLEAILGVPIEAASREPGEDDYATDALAPLLARARLDDGLRNALVEARRAGKPGRWARIGREAWSALGPDPALRAKAWRDIEDPEAEVREEAVGALLGAHHDAADGAVDELARRLYERPALRAAVLRRHDELLAEAREDLVRGALDLDAAAVVLAKTPRAEETDAMWEAARALRERAIGDPTSDEWASSAYFFALVRETEEGPDPRDLPYIRAVVERALTVEGESMMLRFASEKLARMAGEESTALAREIDERATTEEQRRQVRVGREYARR